MALMNRYRIVTDRYSGFEVQIKRWWFPFWMAIAKRKGGYTNTNTTLQDARELARKHKEGTLYFDPPKSQVVEYLE